MDELVEEMLSQAPMLITSAELADYKRRAQVQLDKARLKDFKRMRGYYGRGNLKLWDEPDNNDNPVYLDDHIASLKENI